MQTEVAVSPLKCVSLLRLSEFDILGERLAFISLLQSAPADSRSVFDHSVRLSGTASVNCFLLSLEYECCQVQ